VLLPSELSDDIFGGFFASFSGQQRLSTVPWFFVLLFPLGIQTVVLPSWQPAEQFEGFQGHLLCVVQPVYQPFFLLYNPACAHGIGPVPCIYVPEVITT
jgi:hypothetical protein